jgi:hypothetical protein
MTAHESPVGETAEWYTPPQLFAVLGIRFDLDPASPMAGPVPWVPADRFYSAKENGLIQNWQGRVWLNPPFGPMAVPFVQRMRAHRNGMLLLPSRTETQLFQGAAPDADAVCFLRDRLHFIRLDGFQARSGFPSALMAWGADCAAALRSSSLGWIPA